MKKLFALLLTVVMMASMMVPAMADYNGKTEHTPNNSKINHSLQLTESEATSLLYNITYKFTVNNPEVVDATTNGVTNDANLAITGKPVIYDAAVTPRVNNSVTYGPSDTFDSNKTTTKELTVDWSGVKVNEPGIYRWKIDQEFDHDAPLDPTNASNGFYLYLYVTDNAGELGSTVILSKSETIDPDTKNSTLEETYPAKTINLTIKKLVDGNQASKDQYFPFDIVLTAPGTTATTFTYTIQDTTADSYDEEVPATAYHPATTNPTSITVSGGTTGTFRLWLKHNQSVTINDIVFGSTYTITESGNDGYTVTAAVTDQDTTGKLEGMTTSDTDGLSGNAIVTYTNTKSTTVPTGISLQSGVAFFGFALAMGMMVLLFVGKRKEQN